MYTEHPTSPSQSTEPSAGTGFSASNVSATAPGQLRVIKRNGTVVSYDVSKISVAMTKAFLAVEGDTAAVSGRVHETVNNLTDLITATFKRRMPSGRSEEHTSELQSRGQLVCRLLLEKKKK